ESQLAQSIEAEAGQNIPYEVSEVFLDWAVLDRVTEGDSAMLKVLLVATKHEVIDSRVQVADAAGIEYGILGVDSLALADAAEACDFLRVGESVALVNMGASTTSIHFVKDGISNFIRDVNWGAREMIQAIAKARRCETEEAEQVLIHAQFGASPEPDGTTAGETPQPPPEQPDTETRPLGGSLLDPLDDELGGLEEPLAGPSFDEPSQAGPPGGGPPDLKDTLSMPIGRLVSEIRRSFDYYEQQLYEQPVDRLILSGGAAQVPLLTRTLSDELGIEAEVANPAASALMVVDAHAVAPLQNSPAQFMVAVGLAARGAAEL
ncbi:MAG: type IV pilus assembly protein PilM, partial [Candidatus Hydrogenedentes bacterium]|nr:type IV pilus assembly protein PilM [Candidatus Hydrogenedentota bacterium]